MSEKTEVVCGGCGKPLFYGEVLAELECRCGRCGLLMRMSPAAGESELADAIVEALKAAPVVNDKGQTVCNCEACRNARN